MKDEWKGINHEDLEPLERERYEMDRSMRLRPKLFWLEITLLLFVISITVLVFERITGLPQLTLFLVLSGAVVVVKLFAHNPNPPT